MDDDDQYRAPDDDTGEDDASDDASDDDPDVERLDDTIFRLRLRAAALRGDDGEPAPTDQDAPEQEESTLASRPDAADADADDSSSLPDARAIRAGTMGALEDLADLGPDDGLASPDDEPPGDEPPGPVEEPPTATDASASTPSTDDAPTDATAHVFPTPKLPTEPASVPSPSVPSEGALSEGDDLFARWADDALEETDAPSRNWSIVVAPLLILGLLVVAGAVAWMLIDRSGDDDEGGAGLRGEDAEAGSVLEEDPPSLEDLTADITVPPGPEVGIQVVESGVTVVEDRFDEERREGTFAVVLENPNLDQVAQNVQVDVEFVDDLGRIVGSDTAFVELVLPGQRVAVAALVFDAPTEPVVDLLVEVDVARWREVEASTGGFEVVESETTAAEFSGVRTAFALRSTFEDDLVDVAVSAVYRREDGSIIGGADTFIELLEPGTPTPGEIVLLANIDIEEVASTELYAAASFAFAEGS